MPITEKQTVCVNSGFAHPADTTKQVQFDMSGITANSPAVIAVPNASGTVALTESGTFTGTLTGCTTSPTATINYTKTGRNVTLSFGVAVFISGTSNASSKTITGMPSNLYPATNIAFMANVVDNSGLNVFAYATLSTSGVLSFFKDATGASFTSSGTCNINPMPLSYVSAA